MDPAQLRYARTHEWLHVAGDVGTVGISDFATEQLTDIVHLELPEIGRTVSAGDACGEIESTKAVNDLYAPVSGEVIETNTGLLDDLSVLSNDPYGAGWLLRLRMTDPAEAAPLLDRTAYEAHCASEEH
ncbi:MAG: glycine cleavage system protein GcvH [Planctomycetaceae bacterium]